MVNVGLVRFSEICWLVVSSVLFSMSSPLSLLSMKWYYYEFMVTWCVGLDVWYMQDTVKPFLCCYGKCCRAVLFSDLKNECMLT